MTYQLNAKVILKAGCWATVVAVKPDGYLVDAKGQTLFARPEHIEGPANLGWLIP